MTVPDSFTNTQAPPGFELPPLTIAEWYDKKANEKYGEPPPEPAQLSVVTGAVDQGNDDDLREGYEAALRMIERLKSQLPEGMQKCTIQSKSCKVGHGWLTATNWVQHGCPTCERDALKSERDELLYKNNQLREQLADTKEAAPQGWWLGEECSLADIEKYHVFDFNDSWWIRINDEARNGHFDVVLINDESCGRSALRETFRVRPVHFGAPSKTWRYGEWTTVGELRPGADFEINAEQRFKKTREYFHLEDKCGVEDKHGYTNGAIPASIKCREIILEGQ